MNEEEFLELYPIFTQIVEFIPIPGETGKVYLTRLKSLAHEAAVTSLDEDAKKIIFLKCNLILAIH